MFKVLVPELCVMLTLKKLSTLLILGAAAYFIWMGTLFITSSLFSGLSKYLIDIFRALIFSTILLLVGYKLWGKKQWRTILGWTIIFSAILGSVFYIYVIFLEGFYSKTFGLMLVSPFSIAIVILLSIGIATLMFRKD